MSGRYTPYRNYQKTDYSFFENVPSHWEVERIKFNSYVKGRQGWQNLRADEYQDEGPFLITGAHFDGVGGVDWSSCYHVSEDRYKRDQDIWVHQYDVLMTKDGSIGKIAYISSMPDKACLNSHLLIIRALNRRYDQRFLYHLLSSSCFSGFIGLRQTGTTFFGITQEAVEEFPLLIPSIVEQQAIANFLDHETAKIDTLIDKQQQLIKLLKEKRQAVISHAVTKGLNPAAPMKDSGVEWLGEVPEHWVVTRAKYLFDFVTSGSRGWAEYYSDSGSLFFRIANLTRDTIEPKMESIQFVMPPVGSEGERSKIKLYDLLISITADLGSVCVADQNVANGYVSQHVSLCRPNSKVASSRWLGYVVLSDGTKEQFIGAGYGGTKIQLSLENIREFWVAMPPDEEQQEIARHIDEKLDQYAALIGKAELQIALLQERRTALISAAVTGKIDVRNWQPAQTEIPMEACA